LYNEAKADLNHFCSIIINNEKNEKMKKLAFSALFGSMLLLGMTSCKKDYTCDCKDGNGNKFDSQTYPNTSITDAKRSCNERENFWKNTTVSSANCTIL